MIGSASNKMATKEAWMKNLWGYETRLIYCLPGTIIELFITRDYWKKIKKSSTWKNVLCLPLSMIFQMFWMYGLMYGSQKMIQSHAYICSTMYGVFVILIGYAICIKPYKLELFGLFFTLCGIICMFSDPSAERIDGIEASSKDYIICIFAAFLGAFFILVTGHLAKLYPMFFLLEIQGVCGFVFITILLKTFKTENFSYFSIDK